MVRKNQQQLFHLLFAILIFAGCSQTNKAPQTLSLSLVEENGDFRLSSYQILDRPYQRSPQQGRYQAHLLDKEQKVMRKVTFDRIDFSSSPNTASNQKFNLALPLVSGLTTIIIYQLDGSSGHFQLKTDDPLLKWTLPRAIKEKYGSTVER